VKRVSGSNSNREQYRRVQKSAEECRRVQWKIKQCRIIQKQANKKYRKIKKIKITEWFYGHGIIAY
jgi:hypothetical protein